MRLVAITFAALLCWALPARADWTMAAFLGASHTNPATLELNLPASGIKHSFTSVSFDSESFESPPYYGYRLGWFPGRSSRVGLEAELIHLKVFSNSASFSPIVQRFSISHGLNLLLGNVVWRLSRHARVGLQVRGGVGVAIPHGESVVLGIAQEQYEVSSIAVQGAAGPTVRVTRHLHAFGEFKVSSAAPNVSVAGGNVRGRYTSQHVAFGLGGSW
jgi:hypothetical protein